MGRNQKFTDDQLLEAVVQYADKTKTKIKTSELARWARINVKGLEEVQEYHFTRPFKNPVTGKYEKKLCTQRLEEYNSARSIKQRENKSFLLSASNVDRFFLMDDREQRMEVMTAREIYFETQKIYRQLRQKDDYNKTIFKTINEKMEAYRSTLDKIIEDMSGLEKKVNYIINAVEKDKIHLYLEQIGVIDGDLGSKKFRNAIKDNILELNNIDDEIKRYQKMFVTANNDDGEEDENEIHEHENAAKPETGNKITVDIDDFLTDF